MILLKAHPNGGRPLNSIAFCVDREDSKLAFKIGYIKCSNCGLSTGVFVDRHELDSFLHSCYNTVYNSGFNLKEKIGNFLTKQGQSIAHHDTKPIQLDNGEWITR